MIEPTSTTSIAASPSGGKAAGKGEGGQQAGGLFGALMALIGQHLNQQKGAHPAQAEKASGLASIEGERAAALLHAKGKNDKGKAAQKEASPLTIALMQRKADQSRMAEGESPAMQAHKTMRAAPADAANAIHKKEQGITANSATKHGDAGPAMPAHQAAAQAASPIIAASGVAAAHAEIRNAADANANSQAQRAATRAAQDSLPRHAKPDAVSAMKQATPAIMQGETEKTAVENASARAAANAQTSGNERPALTPTAQNNPAASPAAQSLSAANASANEADAVAARFAASDADRRLSQARDGATNAAAENIARRAAANARSQASARADQPRLSPNAEASAHELATAQARHAGPNAAAGGASHPIASVTAPAASPLAHHAADANARIPLQSAAQSSDNAMAMTTGATAFQTSASAASTTGPAAGAAQSSAPMPLHEAIRHIAHSAKQGKTRLDIQLEPAHLGRIHISLTTDASRHIQIHLIADQSATRHMIEQQLPLLRHALAEQGLDLSGFSTGGGSFAQGGETAHGGRGEQGRPAAFPPETAGEPAPPARAKAESAPGRAPPGRLSIHA